MVSTVIALMVGGALFAGGVQNARGRRQDVAAAAELVVRRPFRQV